MVVLSDRGSIPLTSTKFVYMNISDHSFGLGFSLDGHKLAIEFLLTIVRFFAILTIEYKIYFIEIIHLRRNFLYKIDRVNHLSKKDLAYVTIKKTIIEGKFKPDERLVISELAIQLGISEIPIREAINRLNSESFILSKDNSHFVAPLSEQEFLDMLEIRLGLERIALHIAVQKIDSAGIQHQRDIKRKLDIAAKSNFKEYRELHNEFHRAVFKYCGVSYLERALNDAWDHHERGMYIYGIEPLADSRIGNDEHEGIVDLLEKRDFEQLEKIFVQHRRRGFKRYYEILRSRHLPNALHMPEPL